MAGTSYYVIYRDTQNQWRWRYVATNGKIVAVSSEAYHHKTDCEHSINLTKAGANAPVIER